MLAIEARRVMRAAPDRVFAHIGRIEHLPRYGAPLWMTAEAVEKRRNAEMVTLTGYLIGLPIESVQRVTLRPPYALEFKQVRGTLRALNGQCSLHSVEDGTEVQYRLEVDLGIAMISDDAARQFLIQFVERFLDRIKLAAERKPPTRRPARAGGPEVAAPDEEDEPEAARDATAAAPQDRAAPDVLEGDLPPEEPSPSAMPAPRSAALPEASMLPAPPKSPPEQPRPGRRRHRRHRRRGGHPGGPATGAPASP